MKAIKSIFCLIERPDGSTFEQEVEVKNNDINTAVRDYQKALGNPYGYYRKNGQLCKYIKSGAYLVVNYRLGKVL